jgi:hypothetical protein
MRNENRYFDVFPKVVRAGCETTIAIRPLFDHCRFSEGGTYQVTLYPMEESAKAAGPGDSPLRLKPVNGALYVPYTFGDEQEHVLHVEEVSGGNWAHVAEFRVYALAEDLFDRRPYKGDLHMHSHYSDGIESPAYVAGACRRIGLDFMAVTDHRQYAPSLEAIRAFEGVETDLRMYAGEEVHPPDNPLHVVNFGGRFSLNERFREDGEAYCAEVEAIEKTLTDLPPGAERRAYASCVWCFEKIREGGGLGLWCHPYWLSNNRYHVPETLIAYFFDRQPFDALELIAGYHRFEIESNTLQVARYHQERARGRQVPIVGVSDAHGCERGELFGWFYTIVFALSPDLPDLIRGVKDLYSVAVEALPGETPRAFGPFRLAKYAHFLLRQVFPQHDELCVEEGRLMLAHAAGDARAADALRACRGRTAALYDRLWGVT